MSPYSWFAAERIDELIPDAEWRPVFAGGIFKQCGRSSWGLGDQRALGIADCEARAQQHGLGSMRWPDPWPTVDVRVARAMLIARDSGALKPYALAAMRLAFREGRGLAEVEVIEEAARRAGIDPAGLVQASQAPEVKAALRSENDDAVSRGVFGVPTVLVGSRLYWGDDRLEDAAAAAADAAA